MLVALRQALPPNVALWGENLMPDVMSQYGDGGISYYFLPVADTITGFPPCNVISDRAPAFSDPIRNAYRFAMPQFKFFNYPVAIDQEKNWGCVKFIFFNGEAFFDNIRFSFNDCAQTLVNTGLRVEHQYTDCFSTRRPEMLVPTEAGQVYANKFPGQNRTAWMLFNGRYATVRGPVLAADHVEGATYADAWNNQPLTPQISGGKAVLSLKLDPQGLGCVVQTLPEKK